MKRRNHKNRFTGEPGGRFREFDRPRNDLDEVELTVERGTIFITVPQHVPDERIFEHMHNLHGVLILESGRHCRLTLTDIEGNQGDATFDVTDASEAERAPVAAR